MDVKALQKEIELLSDNSTSIQKKHVYSTIIYSIKGNQRCEEERKKFVISRSLPIDKMNDPSIIQSEANSFLNCYTDMVQYSSRVCANKFNKVFNCLAANRTLDQFPKKCVADMEDFMYC